MSVAYLALGSNLGDRRGFLDGALHRLRAEPGLRLMAVSRYYETAPVGGPPQGPYLNAAAKVETTHTPRQLLELCRFIEKQHGRERRIQNGPRTLDLDLLLYDDLVLDSPDLTLPHPRMQERAFVLLPLAEFAGSVVHPILKQTVSELLARISPEGCDVYTSPTAITGELEGQRALITGSTSGIGAAIADRLEQQGASVIRHGSKLADFRDSEAVNRLAEQSWADGLDILVCNAGADTLTSPMAKASFEEKLDALLAVDLKATMSLSRSIGERMKARGRGVILTIGWDQAETGMEGDSGQLFTAVKAAVMAFTRSLARTLAPEVRVNGLAPGWIRTAWGETASEIWQQRVRRETPLARWGLPEDVADAALWLVSPRANFITGQIIRVNGGVI